MSKLSVDSALLYLGLMASIVLSLVVLAVNVFGLFTLNLGHGDGSNPQGFLFWVPLNALFIGLSIWLGRQIWEVKHG